MSEPTRRMPSLYIHAKVIDVDRRLSRPAAGDRVHKTSPGPASSTTASLVVDLGPAQANIVDSVAATVRSDFAGGEPWTA
jgi:hypothetical protein